MPLPWLQALDADPDRPNVNGGAIALGHPLGASGTRLMATLIHVLRARQHSAELPAWLRDGSGSGSAAKSPGTPALDCLRISRAVGASATMSNPFLESVQNVADEELVPKAQGGDRDALERLLARHQPWILNVAVRMLGQRQDAEDATQEILIRVLKSLHTFRGDSKFRTWLYRIAANHLLNFKRQEWVASQSVCSFADAAVGLGRVPDFDPPDPRTVPVPVELLVEEIKIGCLMGTLLCLDGRQRLVFILAELFGASDEIGGEVVGVTPANFRQILSRARRDLYEYLRGNCGLVDSANRCKCVRKTRAFIDGGFVDPQTLQFKAGYRRHVRDVAESRADAWREAYEKVAAQLYRDHPFYEPAEQASMLRTALASVSLDATK